MALIEIPGLVHSSFPDTWTDDQAIDAIERIANNTNSVWHQKSGSGVGTDTIGGPNPNAPTTNLGIPVKYEIIGQDHGLTILVAMEPSDRGVVSGYVVKDSRMKK